LRQRKQKQKKLGLLASILPRIMTAFLRFKLAIANQLSKHAPCSPKEITTLMRTPKLRKDGHISISLPKLNASLASPIQDLETWSKDITEKVIYIDICLCLVLIL
jgi:hypothetical protein